MNTIREIQLFLKKIVGPIWRPFFDEPFPIFQYSPIKNLMIMVPSQLRARFLVDSPHSYKIRIKII